MADEDGRRRLGRLVVRTREALGLERKDLASLSTLSYPYVAQIENGDREPSLRALQSIAGALGLGVAELTGALEGQVETAKRRAAPGSYAPNPAFAGPPPPAPAPMAASALMAAAPMAVPVPAAQPAPGPVRAAAPPRRARGSVARRSVVAELHELLERLEPAERLTALGELQGLVLADVVRAEIAART